MSPLLYLTLSIRALMANKLRSTLAILGVVIGVAAVVYIVSIGEAASRKIQDQIASLGSNRVIVIPGSQLLGGFRSSASVHTLTVEDFDALLNECPSIKEATPSVRWRGQVVRGSKNWNTRLEGVYANYLSIRAWPLAQGRFFSPSDVRTGTKVCVLGQTIVDELFPNEDPLGKTVRIGRFPFRVLGVLSEKGEAPWGRDFDDTLITPFTTTQQKLLGIQHVQWIQVSALSPAHIDSAQEEIEAVLRRRHRIQPNEENDFFIRNQKEIAEKAQKATGIMTALLGVIAGISLLVGGVGVMNIMLVSVTERTREIGIRMAVGARSRDILSQFLAEAVCLTGLGGCLGITLAVAATYAFESQMPWEVRIAPWAAILSFSVATVVGIVFGLYPAYRASRMEPVDALRQV